MKWSRTQSDFDCPGVCWLAERQVLEYLTELQTEVLLFFFFESKGKHTQQRKRNLFMIWLTC